MKKVKEPAPHVKAAQIEKEAVRALSVDEVEEALTKSTYGAIQFQQEDKRIHELEKDLVILKTECSDLKNENRRLKESIELTNGQLHVRERELDEAKKTISKMRYAHDEEVKQLNKDMSRFKLEHDEEVRALEDELTESKIIGKKAGEYASMLDADSDTFETILELAKIIHGLAKNAESVSLLIKDEIEGHI